MTRPVKKVTQAEFDAALEESKNAGKLTDVTKYFGMSASDAKKEGLLDMRKEDPLGYKDLLDGINNGTETYPNGTPKLVVG
jgi:hypothetical protein